MAEVVQNAGESRQDLRDYAIELLKEQTEVGEAPRAETEGDSKDTRSSSQAVGIGVLLGVVAVPLFLLFPPVGAVLLLFGVVMIVWGIVAGALGR